MKILKRSKPSQQASPRPAFMPSAISLAAAALLGLAPAAWAQNAAEPAEETDKPKQGSKHDGKHELKELPQVTVTATRSKTSLMKTPIAVTAISADELLRDNVKEVRNLSGMVPNVQFGLSPADSGVVMSIRGVSSTNFTEIGDPAVGIHVDGIYSPRPQGALALMFDLDGIEVLRGAQGTLFGRNSTAGVININLAKPDFKSDYGWTSVQLGNYNARQLRTVYNKSFGDKFALRGAFVRDTRDGFITQERDMTDRGYRVSDGKGGFVLTPNGKPDVDQRLNRVLKPSEYYYNSNQWAGRLAARWAIAPELEWQASFDRFQNNGAGEVLMRDCEMAAGTARACGPEGQWHAKINVPGKLDMTMDSVRSLLTWRVNPGTDVQLRTGYSVQSRSQHQDNDGGLHAVERDIFVLANGALSGPIPNVTDEAAYVFDSRYKTTVHELQLKHEAKNWRTVVGAFYMGERNAIEMGQDQLVTVGWPNNAFPRAHYWDQTDRRNESKALFAQGDLRIFDRWTATAGIRMTRDSRSDVAGKSIYMDNSEVPWYYNGKFKPYPLSQGMPHDGTDLTFEMGPFAGASAFPAMDDLNTKSESYKNTSYRLGLQFDIDQNQMIFGSLATAYRPGGFSDRTDRCGGASQTCTFAKDEANRIFYREYKPEHTKNFELGYKGRLLDRTLDISLVAFNTDFTDMHYTNMHTYGVRKYKDGYCGALVGQDDCVVRGWMTQNIGESTIRGLELEFKSLPWSGGQLSGFASFLDAKIKQWDTYDDDWLCNDRVGEFACPNIVANTPGVDVRWVGLRQADLKGKSLPRSPKFSFALNYAHDFGLGQDLTLTPSFGYRWQSKMYFTPRNLEDPNFGAFQKAYGNLNAALKLAGNSGKWDVELWGTNLTDNLVKTWVEPISSGRGVRAGFAAPRMFGLRATVNY
ncbi:TonB-dependent receptor [Paucibacter sp. KBW04]|uniref:TonB-dependent receptor n=1 Tax=Paucibacter sp. KBW04 TaxID=2153361 RepID=UPI000F55BBCD|nr:TonB-dependent receptor [Paucibacter sp. KBW04]RQO61146.1 TonB-dependent receptor [Paucibacter sp. KBW04]